MSYAQAHSLSASAEDNEQLQYLKQVGIDENHLSDLYAYAGKQLECGLYFEASQVLTMLVRLNKNNVEYWFSLGYSYYMMNKIAEASASFGIAIVLKTDDPRTLFFLSKCMDYSDMPEKALRGFLGCYAACQGKPEYHQISQMAHSEMTRLRKLRK